MKITINDGCTPCEDNSTTVLRTCTVAPTCLPCATVTGCPIQLDLMCTIYHKDGLTPSNLTTMGLENGATGEEIIERIDELLGSLNPFTFATYDLACLPLTNVITNFSEFVGVVSNELCTLQTNFDTLQANYTQDINDLEALINGINVPAVSDACGLNIQVTDTIAEVLVKLKDGYCNLYSLFNADTSPVFNPINSSTISWLTAGVKNHTPTASVKKSAQAGNTLQILADGLYVPEPASVQVLGYVAGSKTITLSNGGGQVALPPDADAQLLGLDIATKTLAISDGNSVDLTPIIPTFTQTSITPTSTNSIQLLASGAYNTNMSANVKISTCVDNILTIEADGLCATPPAIPAEANDKVKASIADTTNGYLIDKVEGCVNGALTTTVAYNGVTDKITVCGEIALDTLVTLIAADATAFAALCDALQGCLCFTFKLENTDASPTTYNYVDCSGVTHTGVAIGAGAIATFCGRSVVAATDLVVITNQGYC